MIILPNDSENLAQTFIRQGLIANIPILINGETYWATDTQTLHVGQANGKNKVFYPGQIGYTIIDAVGEPIQVDCSFNINFYIPFYGDGINNSQVMLNNMPEGKWITVVSDNYAPGYGEYEFIGVIWPTDEPTADDTQTFFYSFIKFNGKIFGTSRKKYPYTAL